MLSVSGIGGRMITTIELNAEMQNALREKRMEDNEPGVQQSSEKAVEGDAQDIAQDTEDTSDIHLQQDAEPGVQQSSEKPAEGE